MAKSISSRNQSRAKRTRTSRKAGLNPDQTTRPRKLLSEELIQAFPLFSLPGVQPARTSINIPEAFPRIKSARDLPEYLVFGELQKESLKFDGQSWSASWGESPHSGELQCKYNAETFSVTLSAVWRDLEGPLHVARVGSLKDFRQAVMRLFGVLKDYEIPPSWKDRLAQELRESKSDPEYLGNLDGPMASGYPDGPFCTYCYPVGMAELVKLQEILEEGSSLLPESLLTPCAVMAVPCFVKSIYPVEYEPSEHECLQMFESCVDDTGGLPLEYPIVTAATRVGSIEEEPAVLIQLLMYVLMTITPFSGLLDIVDAWQNILPAPRIRFPQRTPFVVTTTPPFFETPWMGMSGASTDWILPADGNAAAMLNALSVVPSARGAIAQIKVVRKLAAKFSAVAERIIAEEAED